MTQKLHHACAVEINGKGILIEGPSGSGKTSTALRLLEHAKLHQQPAHLISDDQVFLAQKADSLLATVPENIAGKVEIRGFGITDYSYAPQCEIKLVARIVDDDLIERMPDVLSIDIQGMKLPTLHIPAKHEELATRIIFAWLDTHV